MSKKEDKIKNYLEEQQEKYLTNSINSANSNQDDVELDDLEFDALEKYYEDKTGKHIKKEYNPEDGIPLYYPMPSINKIKGDDSEKKIKKFLKEVNEDDILLISCKLDGSSLQIKYPERVILTGGGHGETGKDVSFLFDYLNLPEIEENVVIRGELTMSNKNFEKLHDYLLELNMKAKNPRSLVNGVVNSKNKRDKKILKKCRFIAFSIPSSNKNTLYQYKKLIKYGFEVPDFFLYSESELDSNFEQVNKSFDKLYKTLSKKLKYYNEEYDYQIDGLVVTSIDNFYQIKENEPPSYAFAYKEDTYASTTVIGMEWRSKSKAGYLTPVAILEEVSINGKRMNQATCHNAKYVVDNELGIGSVVTVTFGGDVIPYIAHCITGGEIVYPEKEYKWDKNEVEFMLVDLDDEDVKEAKLAYFTKILGIKGGGPSLFSKLVEEKIDTIEKLVKIKVEKLQSLERMGEVSAEKFISRMKKALEKATWSQIMSVSQIFGEKISVTIFDKFIDAFPNWELENITKEQIMQIRDFGEFRSTQIADNLQKFKDWIGRNPKFRPNKTDTKIERSNELRGKIYCFSGIRNKTLEEMIKEKGGIVKSSLTLDVNTLIVKKVDVSSNKILQAKQRGVEIIQIDKFSI